MIRDEHERLIEDGWALTQAEAVANTVFDYQATIPVSMNLPFITQLDYNPLLMSATDRMEGAAHRYRSNTLSINLIASDTLSDILAKASSEK